MTPDEAVERQAMRTKAPILSRWSRIVLQVAVANWVCLRPIRRKAHTRRCGSRSRSARSADPGDGPRDHEQGAADDAQVLGD